MWQGLSNTTFLSFIIRYIKKIQIFVWIILSVILLSFKNYAHPNFQYHPDPPDTIYVYDTIFLYDTIIVYDIIKDTVSTVKNVPNNDEKLTTDTSKINHIAHQKTTKTNKKPNKSFIQRFKTLPKQNIIGVQLSYFNPTIYEQGINEKNTEYAELRRKYQKFIPGYNLAFQYFYSIPAVSLETGIRSSIFLEKFDYEKLTTKIEIENTYSYFQNSKIKLDTIFFINIDSLLVGDTVYTAYIDTFVTYFTDSVLHTRTDTIKNITNEKSLNKYLYLEIPVVFHYNKKFKKTIFNVHFGAIAGFLIYKKGKTIINADNYPIAQIENKIEFPTINLSLLIGCGIEYYLNKKTIINSGIYFRQSLNPFFENSSYNLKYRNYGISLGLKFIIN